MPSRLFISWVMALGFTQLTAQIQLDTIRENIDYRIGLPIGNRSQRSDRSYTHYASLQINQLFEAIGGYKPLSTGLRNPYNLTYTINKRRTGYGVNFGFGYESSAAKTAKWPNPTVNTATGKTAVRIGFDKKHKFLTRWIMGIGMDLLYGLDKHLTKKYSNGFIQETYQQTTSYGLGPRATIQYSFWNRFRLGTEVCLYFDKLNITTSEKFTGLPTESSTKKSTSNTLLLPVSVFISTKIW